MYDQNQVSVSGTETKVQFWYQYWSQNFSFRNFFFHKRFLKNQIFVMFSHFLGNTDFYKLQKKIKKFGFVMEKIQLDKYETAPNFIQLNQNLTSDCLLI